MMNIKNRGALLAAVCVATLSLAACGQGKGEGETKGNPLENVVDAAKGGDATEKFNGYVEGFNKLIDDNWGVQKNYVRYQELDLPSKSPDANIHFFENITTLDSALKAIKEARAMSGNASSNAADAAADKVIANGDKLLAQWKELAPYYSSRAYREDALAKGKAAHESLIANYTATLAAIDELDVAITKYQRDVAEKRIVDFRKSGHNSEADVVEAMYLADHFTTAVIEEKIADADAQLPKFQAAVTKLRQTEQGLAADATNKSDINSLVGYLESLIGNWRDYKQSNSNSDLESVVDYYNRAIGEMDDIEMPG